MHKLSTIMTTATENKNIKPTAIVLNSYEQDLLFTDLSDLTNSDFRAWYCKAFKILGREQTLRLASIARADGKNPRKYFSHLIKRHAQSTGI